MNTIELIEEGTKKGLQFVNCSGSKIRKMLIFLISELLHRIDTIGSSGIKVKFRELNKEKRNLGNSRYKDKFNLIDS